MNGIIKAQWISRLQDSEMFQCSRYLHMAGGTFDCLGVLCDLYLQAIYMLPTGGAATANALLKAIQATRTTLLTTLLGHDPLPNIALNNAVINLFTVVKGDKISPNDRGEIKASWLAIRADQLAIEAAYPTMDTNYPVEAGNYGTAVEMYRLWLAGLTGPGGWDGSSSDWRHDYTSVDTETRWTRDSLDNEYYTLGGLSDKLPESVATWAELYTQDPVLTVQAHGFAGELPFFLNELNDGTILKPSGDKFSLSEISGLIDTQL